MQNILCVDDNEDNNEILRIYLEDAGFRVTTCGDAAECLEIISADRFAAVVLDYFMPGKDGLELFREIRGLGLQMPVIFFTADAFPHSRELVLEAGVDDYLVKPEDLPRIASILSALIMCEVSRLSFVLLSVISIFPLSTTWLLVLLILLKKLLKNPILTIYEKSWKPCQKHTFSMLRTFISAHITSLGFCFFSAFCCCFKFIRNKLHIRDIPSTFHP